jgi:putative hemolysin
VERAAHSAQPGGETLNAMWSVLALIGVLIAVNGFLSGSEAALISLHESRLHRLQRSGPAGRRLARLARDPTQYLATVQLGITLCGYLASALATIAFVDPLRRQLESLGSAAEAVAVMTVTMTLTIVTLVFGELVPKRLGLQRAEVWSLRSARPLGPPRTWMRPIDLASAQWDGCRRAAAGR